MKLILKIPELKQALIDSKIWPVKLELDGFDTIADTDDDASPIDMNKTMFVKNYFEKRKTLSISNG